MTSRGAIASPALLAFGQPQIRCGRAIFAVPCRAMQGDGLQMSGDIADSLLGSAIVRLGRPIVCFGGEPVPLRCGEVGSPGTQMCLGSPVIGEGDVRCGRLMVA